jgi:hypothetical protein
MCAVKAMSHNIYWHRELPPLNAKIAGEHTIEATSARLAGTLTHRSELWDRCYADLMTEAKRRLQQEIVRLGGTYAHVIGESIEPRRDDTTDEAWLHGTFTYILYGV